MLQISNLNKQYGPQILFENLSFTLGRGEKVGLVGKNGHGKSTLLKIIMGEEGYDSGTVSIPKDYSLGILRQHIEFTKENILDECSSVLIGERQYDLHEAEKILFGLGFSDEDLKKHPRDFSGGQQLRVHLAKALLESPDLLLLDEPTNYLDIVSLRWLKKFLRQYKGELILITHDRDFMDGVVTHIAGISRRDLKKVKGTTSNFYQKVIEEDEIYEKTKANQDKKRAHLQSFVDRFRAKATKAKQAQSRLKQLEKMGQMDELEKDSNFGIKFPYNKTNAQVFYEISDVSFGYTKENILFDDLSLWINRGDKIGIIGKNGKGKSTLLNVLAGEFDSFTGKVKKNPNISIGHFGQTNVDRLDSKKSIIEEVESSNIENSNTQVRTICGTFMFEGDLAKKKISVLSGGERARVMLAKIIAREHSMLFLDEPTNHLDMETCESLIAGLEKFPGPMLFVSHNEELLHNVATKLIVFQNNKVDVFEGTYAEFLEKIGWEDEAEDTIKIKKSSLSRKERLQLRAELIKERSSTLKPINKKIEDLENLITDCESLLEKFNNQLIDASSNNEGDKIAELSKKVSEYEEIVEKAFEQLGENSELLESKTIEFDRRLEEIECE